MREFNKEHGKIVYDENWEAQLNRNFDLLQEIDNEAKAANSMVGRILSFGYADGYAHYQIVRENKNTVRVQCLDGLGDDWVLPTIGACGTISKQIAMQHLSFKDNPIFGRI
jgi:hypothetical protein